MMKKPGLKFIIVTIIALVAAYISAKFLVQGNPIVAVPWGILAFLSAFIAKKKNESLLLGGCIGFVASYSYLWFDNTSIPRVLSKILFLVVLVILPALFGLLCGTLCAWLGWGVKSRAAKSK